MNCSYIVFYFVGVSRIKAFIKPLEHCRKDRIVSTRGGQINAEQLLSSDVKGHAGKLVGGKLVEGKLVGVHR